jgi:class 3 adenylate cyclase
VGDTVNMSQRLQQLAEAGETVVSQGTVEAWRTPRETVPLPPQLVKGRDTPVIAYRLVDEACRSTERATKVG